MAKILPDAFWVDLWTVDVEPEPISGPRSYRAAKDAFRHACSTNGLPCTMAIGFVRACIKGEGLQPSLLRSEFRLPKGHQQAQRSDIALVMIQRETLPSAASIVSAAHARAAALRQRCERSRASAGRSGALARGYTRRSLKGSYLLLLAPIVWRSSLASHAQS